MPHGRGGAPFVGRVEDLAALDAAFAATDHGLVVALVAGDPGIGKTALTSEFSDQLRARGVAVHWGSCVDIGGAPAFWPWIQVVRSLGAESGAASLIDARAEEPFAAYHTTLELLRERAGEPLVVVLDDLHRADLPSLELLRALATSRIDLPVLIVGTHRVHELRTDRERDALLGAVATAGRRISPGPLGHDEVTALLASALGTPPEPDMVEQVLERSGGNALYVVLLAEAVRGHGPAGLAEVPPGLRSAVRARLGDLPAATVDLLSRASVLGPGFPPELLAAVTGLEAAVVGEALAPAVDAGLLVESDGELAFAHSLLREALGEELGRPDRLRIHFAAAHLLAGRSGVPASVIAQHLLDAGELGEPAAIAGWAESSARAARRLGGHVEAARWALVAARHWGVTGDMDRQGAMLAESVNDSITAGDGSRATELCGQLADLARRAGSGRLLARAALAHHEAFGATAAHDVPPLIREALDHPDLTDDPTGRADLLGALAGVLGAPALLGPRSGADEARQALAELAALADGGDPRCRARLAQARLTVDSGPAHHTDRRRWLADYEAHVPPGPGVLVTLEVLYWRTSLAFEAGDLLEVERLVGEWEITAQRSSSTFWIWRASMARASLRYAQGALAEAEELARDRAVLLENLNPELAVRVAAGLTLAVRRDQGRLGHLLGSEMGDLGPFEVLAALEAGEPELVRRRMATLVEEVERSGPDDLRWLCLLSLVAVAADASGDVDRCRWAADLLEPYRDQSVMWGRSYVFAMPVAEALGLARRGAGRLDLAAAAFCQVVEWADRVGAPGFAARGRAELASVLPADHPELASTLAEARRVAVELGMGALLAAMDERFGPPPPTSPVPAATGGTGTSSASAGVGPAAAPRARIRTLGRFEVVGAGSTEPARWSSRKARDCLKILICRRGRATPREELIDLLWPDVDVATGRGRLSVVLSVLRNALDPERVLVGDPVRADRQSVGLDFSLVEVDVEQFLEHARRGLGVGAATGPDVDELRRAAEHVELGEFLAEDPYAEFAAPLRATAARTGREVLRALAVAAGDAGHHDEAALWWARLSDLDPDDPVVADALRDALATAGHQRDGTAGQRDRATERP